LSEGIVLFAHGSREREWARPFEALARAVSQKTNAQVELAFLELMQPSLDEAIAALARHGVASIRIVPVFLGRGGHISDDLPRLVARAQEKHPHVAIRVEAPIGEQSAVLEAIAAAIARAR
jgi:sirohydrochlorin cobaltochelatase